MANGFRDRDIPVNDLPPAVPRSDVLVGPPMFTSTQDPPPPVQGMPGTMTVQLPGQETPTTSYVPHIGPQPLPSWYTDYETKRQAFLDEQERRQQVDRMMQAAQPQSTSDYLKAMEAATRLEGQLGFASDIKAGVPMPQALARWGSKMNPQTLRAMQESMPKPQFNPTSVTVDGTKLIQTSPNRFQIPPLPASTETGPVQGRPIMMGERQVGVAIPGRGGSMHVMRDTPERSLTPTEEISALRLQMSEIDKDIENTRDKAEVARLQAEKTDLRKRLAGITSKKASSSTITTKEEYDALPSGSIFTGKDGRRYKKP